MTPTKPPLPAQRPYLDRDAWADIRAATSAALADDVGKAYGAAGEAMADGDLERAEALLAWAKAVAPRSGVVREALGVLRYTTGDFAAAQSELQTYRRLSGRNDQNHLLADCARAAGRHERVQELVDEMVAGGVSSDRVAEGLLVLAGDRADRGDLQGAMDALERAGLQPSSVQPWHPRLWYFAAELSERAGDPDAARDYFEAILAVAEDFGDVAERLQALG